MDELLKLIQGVGFPTVVAGFVLWRIDSRLNRAVILLSVIAERVGLGAEAGNLEPNLAELSITRGASDPVRPQPNQGGKLA